MIRLLIKGASALEYYKINSSFQGLRNIVVAYRPTADGEKREVYAEIRV